MGYLGSSIRFGTPRSASTAAGTALGLLSGQGLSFLIAFRARDHLDDLYLSHVLSTGVTVLLAVGGVAGLLWHRRDAKSWPVFAATFRSGMRPRPTALDPDRGDQIGTVTGGSHARAGRSSTAIGCGDERR